MKKVHHSIHDIHISKELFWSQKPFLEQLLIQMMIPKKLKTSKEKRPLFLLWTIPKQQYVYTKF